MKPTLVKDRTHCSKGHDLRIHGYYFGTNQRCQVCNRGGYKQLAPLPPRPTKDRPAVTSVPD
jgi:hypothetical protein